MTHPGSVLAARVKARAHELGFPLAGIAPADPPPHHEFLVEWLRSGYQGEMQWLGRDPDRRADPGRVLPGAKSVIAVGAPYAPSGTRADPPNPAAAGRGVVSAYASGEDYHRLIEARLAALATDLESVAGHGVESRFYVDHGPLLERPIAARAGLGWIGKNTLLLNQRHGSWFFLGVLLTTLELPADQPESDHCGTCRRCLDACPTAAFPSPYVLDSRRCISYLTIELRGAIPRELRPLIGARIFGCDECQIVCPWTPEAGSVAEPLFAPRADLAGPDLVECLEITESDFGARFGGTPLTRTRRRGLRRNAAVALGNTGGVEAMEPLTRALTDDDPLVRAHAAWALGAVGRRAGAGDRAQVAELLEAARMRETDPEVREELDAATLAIAAPTT